MEVIETNELQEQELQPQQRSVFAELAQVDVNTMTEKKGDLTYLSWSYAWREIKLRCPDAMYEIKHFDGVPYLYDENLGYMVETSVTINGETLTMWLPVMDGKNKAKKSTPYTYKITSYGKTIEKTVEPATMFDINTAIMRCLVKNVAMFGLGLYIYSGIDLPEGKQRVVPSKDKKEDMSLDEIFKYYAAEAIKQTASWTELEDIWYKDYPELQSYKPFKEAMTKRKHELGIF